MQDFPVRFVCAHAHPIMLIPFPADNDSCSGVFFAFGIMVIVGNATKAYLFLLRIRAVYSNSKLATLLVSTGGVVLVCIRLTGTFLVRISVSLTHDENRQACSYPRS